jgi:hypothetical protein
MKNLSRLVVSLGMVAMGCLTACSAATDAPEEAEVGAISQAFSTTFAWGFVWAQQSTGTFSAHSLYSRNSSGGISGTGVTNTITQTGTGTYRVDFPGIGNEIGGNVQVTAYGGGSERCKVSSWGSSGTTLQVFVNCFNSAGAPVNTLFTASYVRRPVTAFCCGAAGAYLWANQPSTASYTPSTTYQWNSTGVNNTITRTGVGRYTANLPGMSFVSGTVEVTAYGAGSNHCKVVSWFTSSVDVACFTAAGAPADSLFTLNYDNVVSPNGGPSFAYTWADQPSTASYTPNTTYQYGALASECDSFDGPITIQRTSVGRYAVQIPTLSPTGSNVKVTAYGSGGESCKVVGWFGSGTGTEVDVACFDASGAAVDTLYVVVYTTDQFIIC